MSEPYLTLTEKLNQYQENLLLLNALASAADFHEVIDDFTRISARAEVLAAKYRSIHYPRGGR